MLSRIILPAILITLSLLFTGCYGSTETDDVAYLLVIGIDKGESGKERVTYQVAIPRQISSDSNDSSDTSKNWLLSTIMIPGPADARMLLQSTMSRTPKFNHLTAYVISEERAREGIGSNIFSYTVRSRDYRETLFLIVVQGSAEEYIKRNKPTLEATIDKFYEAFSLKASQGSYYLFGNLHSFYTSLKNSGGSPYTAYSGINPMTGEDKPADVKAPEEKGDPYLPGGVPRTGTEDPAEFLGLALFRGDKMVGVLNSDETRALALLQGKFPYSYIDVVDPLQPEKNHINLNVRCEHKPKITADLNGRAPVFDVEVKIDGEILSIASGINYEAPAYRALLETQVANLFKGQIMSMIKHTQELGTDPVGFGLYLRPKFGNTGELSQTDLTALYQAAAINVHVTAKLRRTGLIWRTTPIKNE